MAFVFRWLLRIASGLVFLAVGAFALVYYFASRSLPDYDESFDIASISAPVEIVRDNANVPHIFAQTDEDAYFALGFAHAQDRMWQMTMLRRTAQGRLSELLGSSTVASDSLVRRLDLYGVSVRSVAAQDDATKRALRAYSAGVNTWLEEVNVGARGRGAVEMWLFNHAISPWQPADSIAIHKLMALQMSSHAQRDILRARASLVLENGRLRDLMPDDPSLGTVSFPEFSALIDTTHLPRPGVYDVAKAEVLPAPVPSFSGASNAWAAGPTRSATGGTLLANDPHNALTAPTQWYLARLALTSGDVIGATIPGVPAILIGRSDTLGWGMTASFADDQDVFIEEVNSENAELYRTADGWKRFRSRDSIVNVAGARAVTLKLRWTDNGPVLSPDQFSVGAVTPPGHVAALGWTALADNDTSLSAALALMSRTTVEDAVETLAGHVAPSQNMIIADRNAIALKTVGAIPLRGADNVTQGRLPGYGYLIENQWQGVMDYDAQPEVIDPAGDIIANTNNKTIDRPYPNHISFDWGDTQRINRLRRLMQNREVHTRESFIEAQLDTVSYTAQSLLPLIGADLWFTEEAAPEGTPERRRQQALELLAAWNGEMNEHLPEPLIYAAWLRALHDRLIRDDLGPLTGAFIHPDPVFIERVFRDIDGASAWCDVQQSAPEETCTDVARQSLDDALIWIDETYGNTIQSLRWGDAHQATHDHPVLGTATVLHWFVNIRQSTSGGDNTLQRGLTSGTGENPFQNVHAAGYRGVYDFADPDSSVFVTSTGQSGHPLSRYYDNLGELWRRGEYIPMSLDPALARAAALGVTVLRPILSE